MLHAGGTNGFVPNAQLVCKVGTATDYHGKINSENFEKWVVEKLVPQPSTKCSNCFR
jgi:hypothetical protein